MMPEFGHPGDHAVSDHANIIIPNSLLMIYLAADPDQFPTSVVLASKWEYPFRLMTSISRLTVPIGRLIPVSTLLHAEFALEPKKSFICNKIRLLADPNEPKEPNHKQSHRLASFCHSPIWIGVPSFTGPQTSSISSSVTAMQAH
jgi:hypothetical protein